MTRDSGDTLAEVLRRDDAVLVVVDIQERLASVMPGRDDVFAQAELLVGVAALLDVPIVVTRQYPAGLGDLSEPVADALQRARDAGASITTVDKVAFDCFADPSFSAALEESGRTAPVIIGMETHICVVQTALHALERGLVPHVVGDACCARVPASHELALERMRAAGVVVTTSDSAAYELVGQAGTDEFRALLGMVKTRDARVIH